MPVDAARLSILTFAALGMPPVLVKALARAKITTPTPVQAAVLPDALAGRDVLGRAATGSGKTLAFGLPILARLAGGRSKPKSPRALIVVPTRELATQVRSALEPHADAIGLRVATVYGGSPYDRQIKRLRAGADVVVATPGRLQDLINRGACRLDEVQITVLDEADHLCDLGFFPAVSEIVAMTPVGGQRLLLSATLDGDVDRLVREHLNNPVTHDCDPESDKPDIDHHVLVTGPHNKLESTAALLRANPRSIVFTRTRHGATNLAEDLAGLGVATVDLHGSLSQNARERNLRKFKTGQADVVVATDVAARGIHVDGVNLVVHYDAPTEQKAYLHRSGRTARAGNSGTVVTMTTSRHVASVMRLQRAAGVTALHHDARTAPSPMTPESLAATGVTAANAVFDGLPRPSDGSRRNDSRSRGGAARPGSPLRSGGGRRYVRSREEGVARRGALRYADSRPANEPRRRSAPSENSQGGRSRRQESNSRPARAESSYSPRSEPRKGLASTHRRTSGSPTARVPSAEITGPGSEIRPSSSRSSGTSNRGPATKPTNGKKKARWTAAEKRAKAKR